MKKIEFKYYYWPILIFIISTSIAIVWKWVNFQYNMFDLAIFYNAASQPWSNLLYSTIQQHNYFGDHLSPYTLLLKPLLILLPHPLTLTFLQVAFVILGYIPFYNLIKDRLNLNWQKIITYAYFLNHIILGIVLNEFHIELILIPLLLSTIYYLENKNFKMFIVFYLLTMITREDVAVWLFALVPIFLIKKYNWKWIIVPILGLPYFYLATKLIPYFLGAPSYQFLHYYGWLGNDLLSIFLGLFKNIPKISGLFFNIYTLEFILACLMPFLFIPLRKPLYLILGLIPYFLLILGPGQGFAILKFQYSVFIFVGLLIASVESIQVLEKKYPLSNPDHKNISIIFLVLVLGYLQVVWGPWMAIYKHHQNLFSSFETRDKKMITASLDKDKEILGSYVYLPKSPSLNTYALSYAFMGYQQFFVTPYVFNKPLEQVAVDFQDIINYQLRIPQDIYNNQALNFEKIVDELTPTFVSDTNVLFEKNSTTPAIKLYKKEKFNLTGEEVAFGDFFYYKNLELVKEGSFLNLTLPLGLNKKIDLNATIKITWTLKDNSKIERYYPLAYGVLNSSTWNLDELITSRYKLYIPKNAIKGSLELVYTKGGSEITNISNSKTVIDSEKILTPNLIIFEDEVSKAL